MDLLTRIKQERGMATLLITHDLGIVAEHADRVAIMYAGLVVESAPVGEIYANPLHPYTRGLLACIPKIGERRTRLTPIVGSVPGQPSDASCSFLERCPDNFAPCRDRLPPLTEVAPDHLVRCWKVLP